MLEADKFVEIKNCRLCNSRNLDSFVDFGLIPLGNNLLENCEDSARADAYPLAIKRCSRCNHFQLSASVNPKKLYATNYTYLSSVGNSFVEHIKLYAEWAVKRFSLGKNTLVLDVGSNDGLGLQFFKKLGCNVLGVDPARYAAEIANKNNINTINSFFTDDVTNEILMKYGQVDFITSHNVLAHIDEIDKVFKNIYKLLKDSSSFVFEIGYFRNVLENKLFDTIYHEHLDYHHASPIVNYLTNTGFEIVNITTNKIQGGSLRIETRKTGKSCISKKALEFISLEKKSILYQSDFLNTWRRNVDKTMNLLNQKVLFYSKEGYEIAGYGAPTKVTLLLHLSKLTKKEVSYLIEDNLLKVGRYTPRASIPIFSFDELKSRKPEILIIFAWNFADDIIKKLKEIVDWKLKCIVPLPKYKEIFL